MIENHLSPDDQKRKGYIRMKIKDLTARMNMWNQVCTVIYTTLHNIQLYKILCITTALGTFLYSKVCQLL